MSPVQIFTTSSIPLRIARNDQLIVQYTLGTFNGCAPTILVYKGLGSFPITFVTQTPTLSQTL